MHIRITSLVALLVVGASVSVGSGQDPFAATKRRKVVKTDAEWAKALTREQYLVTRHKATEPAFSGKYWNNHARGYYACVGCGSMLFTSKTKFESGTGWPSFYQPTAQNKIESEVDNSTGEPRVEVMCIDCGAHLGHVFNDGPPPTGLRYCINSASLKFLTEAQAKAAAAKQKEQEDKDKAQEKAKGKDSKDKAETPKGDAPTAKPEAGAGTAPR